MRGSPGTIELNSVVLRQEKSREDADFQPRRILVTRSGECESENTLRGMPRVAMVHTAYLRNRNDFAS